MNLDPYCGSPPAPAELWSRWNADPWLLAVLGVLALAFAVGSGGTPMRRWAGLAGVAVLAVAFVSPLCAASSALFSARVLHHLLMIAVAAPLLVLGLGRRGMPAISLSLATGLQVAVLWLWHAPPVYAWALSGPLAYWIMELSLLTTAMLLWASVRRRWGSAPAVAAAMLATMTQMGLLGALLTFAARPLYAAHAGPTWPWGLSPLEDQQLAGLVMWAPGALPYLAVALAATAAALVRAGAIERPTPWRG